MGKSEPYVRDHRYFLRQTIGLGGGTEQIEGGADQLAGPVDTNRLTFTVGKYSVIDIFDDNQYAHDPTNTFLNWSIIEMGAFDYAANSWGFTDGATAEWRQDWWTARAGVFQLSKTPNQEVIEPVLFRQFEPVVEFEERHKIGDQPGKLKFLFYANDGFMGSFNQAVAEGFANGVTPDISSVRARRVKVGGGVNLEQQITPDIGLFAGSAWTMGNMRHSILRTLTGPCPAASRSAAPSGGGRRIKSGSAARLMPSRTRAPTISRREASASFLAMGRSLIQASAF